MKYPLIIFDFDGTLADSLPQLIRILNRLAEKYRFEAIDTDQIDAFRGLEVRQLLKRMKS